MALQGSILVTGTNGGLGSSIVANIVSNETSSQYYGLYMVRDATKATNLQAALSKARFPHQHDILAIDLASLKSVRTVAADIKTRIGSGQMPPIRALIWNAGWQEWTTQTHTEDGFDMAFQINYLSHWLLTLLLLDCMDKDLGRVVVVGSWSHDPTDPRNKAGSSSFYPDDWKTLFTTTDSIAKGTVYLTKDDPTRAGMQRYGASKLCDIMAIAELQKRLDRDPVLSNISVLGVDPGGMPSQLFRRTNLAIGKPLVANYILPALAYVVNIFSPNSVFRPTSKSASDVMRAALESLPAPLSKHPKGLYFNGDEPHGVGAEATDPVKGAMLWKDSVKYVRLTVGDTILTTWE